jgi:hypothetical protein
VTVSGPDGFTVATSKAGLASPVSVALANANPTTQTFVNLIRTTASLIFSSLSFL